VYQSTVYTHIQGRLVYRHVTISDRDIQTRDGSFRLDAYQHLIDEEKQQLEHDYKDARLQQEV